MASNTRHKIRKYEIAKYQGISADLLPIIQNLTAAGYSIADIGLLLGYSGADPEGWLKRLSQQYPEVKDAIQAGKDAANIELIRTAVQEATGYWIEEDETTHQHINDPKHPGKTNWVAKWKKKKRRFIQPNSVLLYKLLCSRLPDYFSDTRKIEVDKRVMELKGNIEDDILDFAGVLGDAVRKRKKIDTKVTDTQETK